MHAKDLDTGVQCILACRCSTSVRGMCSSLSCVNDYTKDMATISPL